MAPRRHPVDWSSLLALLPALEAPDFTPGAWMDGGWFQFSDPATLLIDRLYKANVIYDFDWGQWQDEALRYFEEPALLETADLDVVRRLLSLHVRKDRFFDGHLAEMFTSGHLLAIVKRAQALVNE